MNRWLQLGALGCISSLNLLGCIAATDGESEFDGLEETDTLNQEIRDGQDVLPGQAYAKSTVAVGDCTGTVISKRHVLTAAACDIGVGSTVSFYSGAFPAGARWVKRAYTPWGVSATDPIDTANKFADFVVLQLNSNIPAGYEPAKVPVSWPGNNVLVAQVGRGDHDGLQNTEKIMRVRNTLTYAASNAEGHVLVEAAMDMRDAGGPIYTAANLNSSQLLVHGVAWGNAFEWAWRGKYTSTAFHFWKIATAVGIMTHSNWNFWGNDIVTTNNVSLAECASLCMANTSCNAYTLTTMVPGGIADPPFGRCYQKSGVGNGGSAQTGRFSATKVTTGDCAGNGSLCRL